MSAIKQSGLERNMPEGVDGASPGGGSLGLGISAAAEEEVIVSIFMMFGIDIITDQLFPPPEDAVDGDGSDVGEE